MPLTSSSDGSRRNLGDYITEIQPGDDDGIPGGFTTIAVLVAVMISISLPSSLALSLSNLPPPLPEVIWYFSSNATGLAASIILSRLHIFVGAFFSSFALSLDRLSLLRAYFMASILKIERASAAAGRLMAHQILHYLQKHVTVRKNGKAEFIVNKTWLNYNMGVESNG